MHLLFSECWADYRVIDDDSLLLEYFTLKDFLLPPHEQLKWSLNIYFTYYQKLIIRR